jgi:hypothetical protein
MTASTLSRSLRISELRSTTIPSSERKPVVSIAIAHPPQAFRLKRVYWRQDEVTTACKARLHRGSANSGMLGTATSEEEHAVSIAKPGRAIKNTTIDLQQYSKRSGKSTDLRSNRFSPESLVVVVLFRRKRRSDFQTAVPKIPVFERLPTHLE